MRAVWVDANNDPSWAQLSAQQMTAVYVPLSDHEADVARRLADIRQRNLAAGVYAAWNWMVDSTDGAGFAEWVHERVSDIVPSATNTFPKVQLNNERHEPSVILSMLRRWRELRPKQDTSWTMEGMQGGWMSSAFVAEVTALRVRLVPQAYNGAMTQVWDSWVVARDLLNRGFPAGIISPFYDAAALPVRWDGFAFTQGRLP